MMTHEEESTRVGRSQLHVADICCASEIPAISEVVQPLDGVLDVSINTTTKIVYVDHDLDVVSVQEIANALSKESFQAQVRHDAAAKDRLVQSSFIQSMLTFEEEDPDTATITKFLDQFDASQVGSFLVDVPSKSITVSHNPFNLSSQDIVSMMKERVGVCATVACGGETPDWIEGAEKLESMTVESQPEEMAYPRPAIILSGMLWIISMTSFIGGKWEPVKYAALASVAFGIPTTAKKALKALLRCRLDASCLMFVAGLGAIALQEFVEAATVVFLFAISEWLEMRATSRGRQALSALVQLRPDRASLVHPATKQSTVVPAGSVPLGALVSVSSGEKIPCDGIVVEGYSTVDESSLTGESIPVSKALDDKVSGGTVNSGISTLVVRTTSVAENSAVSKLIRLVEEAQASRSETERIVDSFARVYTPVVVVVALAMCTVPWALSPQLGMQWTYNGLVLIVVACPCALIISTPLSYVAGLAAAAQRGILIKGGTYLETLGQVRQVCFDKTGTLTGGEFKLLQLRVLDGTTLSREEVLEYLAIVEQSSSHPIGHAILVAVKNESVVIPTTMTLEQQMILPGEGVSGLVNGKMVHVGNDRLFKRLRLLDSLSESMRSEVDGWKSLGGTIGYMSITGYGIVCAFCAADVVRPESEQAVADLSDMGIDIAMLTGDDREAALSVASQTGIPSHKVKFKLLPEDKLEYVENVCGVGKGGKKQRSGGFRLCGKRELVLFCGDGVNDALALTAAHVGVAMGAGAACTMETADVTLLDSNLDKLVFSIKMGRRVIAKIRQNCVFSLVVKMAVLGFAVVGINSLWAAIASDVGTMILVSINSMSLLPKQEKKKSGLGFPKVNQDGTKDGECNAVVGKSNAKVVIV